MWRKVDAECLFRHSWRHLVADIVSAMTIFLLLLALLTISAVVTHFGPSRYELPDRSWTPARFWTTRNA